jgi:hypothetical protein
MTVEILKALVKIALESSQGREIAEQADAVVMAINVAYKMEAQLGSRAGRPPPRFRPERRWRMRGYAAAWMRQRHGHPPTCPHPQPFWSLIPAHRPA